MEATLNNTIVIIPSYNEARVIGNIVRHIVDLGMSVLVIDDGSTDHTEREALDNGAMVIRHKKNLGKGVSVRQGIDYVLEKTTFKWMIMMDGDGQHHPEDIPSLIDATVEGPSDIIVGNRMHHPKDMPRKRYLTNRFMSWIISLFCKQHIPDSQSGFRLIKTEALRKIELVSDKFDIESEMLIEASKLGMVIKAAPIQSIYGEEVSAINPVRDTFKFIKLIIRYKFFHNKS